MQLHELKSKHKNRKGRRIGRGGKRGTYSGKGMKGQKSRSGKRMKPAIRTLIKRYPKLKGYSFNPKAGKPVVVNLDAIEKKFKAKETVSPKTLLEKGLISKIKGKMPCVKILGKGKLNKALKVEGCLISGSVKEKIKKANAVVK